MKFNMKLISDGKKEENLKKDVYKSPTQEAVLTGEKCCFACCNIKHLYVKVKSNNVTMF